MASYTLNEDMFQRARHTIRAVEDQVTRADGPIDAARPGWNPLLLTHNSATETMPAYGCGRICGGNLLGDGRTRTISIDKPSTTFGRSYAINASVAPIYCESETSKGRAWGQTVVDGPCLVLYSGDDPSPGDELGPVSGSWALKKTSPSIFTVYGVSDSTNKVAFGRVHEATISPMEVLLQWINQSAYTQTANVSSSNPISARVSTPYVGTAAAAALEILTVSAYNDPCMKVNLAGLWLFTFDISLAAYTITQPPLTGTISTTEGTCSLNNIIQQVAFVSVVITVEKQAAAGGSWTNATTWGSHVYAIGENAGSGNSVLCPKSVLLSLNAGDKLRVRMTAGYENGATATDIVQVSSRLIAHFQP